MKPRVDINVSEAIGLRHRYSPEFEATGFFVLRSPLLPVDAFLAWGADLTATTSDVREAEFVAAYDADCRKLRESLSGVLERPEVCEALLLASQDLVEVLPLWRSDPLDRRGHRIEQSLVRYFTRMTTRPSPFGLFSGWSVGHFGATTHLALAASDTYRRHTQLNSTYLNTFTSRLLTERTVSDRIPVFPNETIYERGGRIYFVDYSGAGDTRRECRSTVETPHLIHLLQRAADGATPAELVRDMRSFAPRVSQEDADAFVRATIKAGLLISGLEAPVIGPEPLKALSEMCTAYAPDTAVRVQVDGVRSALAAVDSAGVRVTQSYDFLLSALPGDNDHKRVDRVLQASLIKPASSLSIGPEVQRELFTALELIQRVGAYEVDHEQALKGFREAFRQRFERRYVRLVDVFDEHVGLEWGRADDGGRSPLVDNLVMGSTQPKTVLPRTHERLRRVLGDAARKGAVEVNIRLADLDDLDRSRGILPDSFAMSVVLSASSEDACRRGDFRLIVQGVSGAPGTRVFGRYCHADRELHGLVVGEARREEELRPDVVFAEIAYAPPGPAKNIVLRPTIRNHEIPYTSRSGRPQKQQILVSDLWVSVSGDRITLYSRRIGKQVVPRLTNAHAYQLPSNLPLYRFLCLLARPAMPTGAFWESDDGVSYLPRVTCGRIVLSRRTWRLAVADLTALTETDGGAQFKAAQHLRAQLGLPRFVGLVQAENTFVVDFANPLSVAAAVPLFKRTGALVKLVEWLPGSEQQCVKGPEGAFAHEFIVPVNRVVSNEPQGTLRPTAASSIAIVASERTFHPGSQWTYLKLYANDIAGDRILCELIGPLIRSWLHDRGAARWFFIRYVDSASHLRLRVRWHQPPDHRYLNELNELCSSTLAGALITRVQCDSYEREIERYGGLRGIDLAERIFQADSECALALLGAPGVPPLIERWKVVAMSVDRLLTDFGLRLTDKLHLLNATKSGLWRQLDCSPTTRRQLAAKYRRERPAVERLLRDGTHLGRDVNEALAARSEQMSRFAVELRDLAESGQLTAGPLDLLRHYVHMSVNRLLPLDRPAYELTITDFLHQAYQSMLSRQDREAGPHTREPASQEGQP